MHQSSYDKVRGFREKYLAGQEATNLTILDLGAQDINGSYKPIFDSPSWRYSGMDMAPGKNVDIILKNIYSWTEIPTHSVDVLVSGQAFEHIEYFWLTMLEMARILKPGGMCCIIAPAGGYEHRYPVDCWRFYPDGFSAMARFARLEILEVSTQWEAQGYSLDESDLWKDSLLIARKPIHGVMDSIRLTLRRNMLQWALRL
ncbi:methyltransferase domain-containing protein [Methylomagnum sp.]